MKSSQHVIDRRDPAHGTSARRGSVRGNLGVLVALLLMSIGLGMAQVGSDVSTPLADARIVIVKSERVLRLYSGDRLVREYPVGLGFNPVPKKTREGDGATPEGEYAVCVKNPRSSYFLSLGLTYPNAEDAKAALASGRISRQQYRAILDAGRRGVCPPWNTALGGEIYIHGSGSGADWTLGCVALDNDDMKELYHAVRIGTPVVIQH